METIDKNKERKEEILLLRKQGLSLREIGEKINLSRQRVHQLLEGEYLNESEFRFSERIKESFEIKEIMKRGFPDFLIVSKGGRICAVEVKSGKDKLSKFQRKVYSYLNLSGLPVFISKNGELNKEIIDFLKNGKAKIKDEDVKKKERELESPREKRDRYGLLNRKLGNPKRDNLIIEEIKKGSYQKDIAKTFGLTPARICQIKKRLKKGRGAGTPKTKKAKQ